MCKEKKISTSSSCNRTFKMIDQGEWYDFKKKTLNSNLTPILGQTLAFDQEPTLLISEDEATFALTPVILRIAIKYLSLFSISTRITLRNGNPPVAPRP